MHPMRPEWSDWFLDGALWVAKRGDCSRRQVGAILTTGNHPDKNKRWRIISTGFNGAYAGGPSCLKGECPRAQSSVLPGSSYDDGPGYCIAIHAEANALLEADRSKIDEHSVIFISEAPCVGCTKLLRGAGVQRVLWPTGYQDWSKK